MTHFTEIKKLKSRHNKNWPFEYLKPNLFTLSYLLHMYEFIQEYILLPLIKNSEFMARDYFSKHRDVFGGWFTNYYNTNIYLHVRPPKKIKTFHW